MPRLGTKSAAALWLALQLVCVVGRVAAVDFAQLTFDEPNLRSWCSEPAWSPEGDRIAFVRGTWSETDNAFVSAIAIVSTSGGPIRTLPVVSSERGRLLCTHPTWSHNGQRLAFSTQHGICVVDLVRHARRMLAADHGENSSPAWSRDGRWIAFQSAQRGIHDIWIIGSDGASPARPLTGVNAIERAPAWSPDGEWVAFESNRDGNFDIWIAPVDGGYPRRITHAPDDDTQPAWSPDGRLLAFTSRRSGNADVWIVPVSGGSATQLTTDPAEDIEPNWSPDGRRIVFSSTRTGRTHIWVASELPPTDLFLRHWKLRGKALR